MLAPTGENLSEVRFFKFYFISALPKEEEVQ